MYVKKIYEYVLGEDNRFRIIKGRSDYYEPPTQDGKNFKNWISILGPNTCTECSSRHGKIYLMAEAVPEGPPLHENCRCRIEPVRAVLAGNGTKNGDDGADWWLKYKGELPEYYITKEDLEKLGWKEGDRPSQFVQGKMLAKGDYENKNGLLPQAPGRSWHEADLNYTPGRRNGQRIVWSNDGLIFVTYDHYHTFYEIV